MSPRVPPAVRMLAVDPGDVHVGVAMFSQPEPDLNWRCDWTDEWTPYEYIAKMDGHYLDRRARTRWVDIVVMESFRLFGNKAMEQVGSDFGAAQLIGWTWYTVWLMRNMPRAPRMVLQGPDRKTPGLAAMTANKIQPRYLLDQSGGHAKDAETHGWYYLLNPKNEETRPTHA